MAIVEELEKKEKAIEKFSFLRRRARFFMGLMLAVVDYLMLVFCNWLSVQFWILISKQPVPEGYQQLFPYILAFILVYLLMGLYTPGVNPVNELRRIFMSTTVMFLFFMSLSFWFRTADLYSRTSLVLSWGLSVILVPIGRSALRKIMASRGLWGEPVAIIGYGNLGYKLVTYLKNNPTMGFIPYVVIDRRKKTRVETRTQPEGFLVKNIDDVLSEGIESFNSIRTAIIVTGEIPGDFYESIIDIRALKFTRLIMVSVMEQTSSLWMQPYDIDGIIGLEVGQNLINFWQQAIKRIIDLILILVALPIIIPFVGLVAILIKLDSKGPVFYRTNRVGKAGKIFSMLKFRTMIPGADKILQDYLDKNPDMLEEYTVYRKLKNDPRITRMGRFLRKFSLDEFPQIWNILLGQMSLVGPRPILPTETGPDYYGKCFNLYVQVVPGLTGLWQVSGRNDLSFEERVKMDEYYVRNWSIWLDTIILTRTPWAVIMGKGAY